MALLWIEGFETFGTVVGTQIFAHLIRKYAPPINLTSACLLAAGRHFGKAVQMQASNLPLTFATPPFTPVDTVIVGFALNVSEISVASDLLRLYEDESIYHLGFQVCNSGAIRLNRAGVTLSGESGSNVIAANAWYYVEVQATIHDTNGSYAVRVNGVLVASASGIDTRNGGTGRIDRVQFRSWTSPTSYLVRYDDIYVLNTLGTDNNTFLGSQVVEALYPATEVRGDWTPSSGTNNAALVDENPTNDDVDFVSSNVVGNKDLYSVGGLSHVTANVRGIQVNVDARVTDVAPLNLRPLLKADAVETSQGGQVVSSTGYKVFTILQEQNPSTNQPWTVAEVNAVQAGIEQVA